MMNYKRKTKTRLTGRQRAHLRQLLEVRTKHYGRIVTPYKQLKGHPLNGDPDGKSRFLWLYGEHPETLDQVGEFFLAIDRGIIQSELDNDWPNVQNIVWWNLPGGEQVLQVYVTHDVVQGSSKNGTFYFMGAFHPDHEDHFMTLARALSEAYAREWGQDVLSWNTTTPWLTVESMDLYEWNVTKEPLK